MWLNIRLSGKFPPKNKPPNLCNLQITTIGHLQNEAIHMPNTNPESFMKDFTPYAVKDGEEYMNENQLAHFKSILLNWKQGLMEEVDRTVNHLKEEAINYADPNDRASQEEEFSFELRARDRERKLVKKISQTIERIEDNNYGFCDECDIDIGIRRLEARPTATLCIDCKTLAEIKEKQIGG